MSLKVEQIPDNTRRVTMISPDGHRCPVVVSPRHNGGRSVEYYRKRGFKTLEDLERDKQLAELEELRRQNAAADKAAKAAAKEEAKKAKAEGK